MGDKGVETAYDVLGVEPDASLDRIRYEYLRLAKDLHPDRHPGDATQAERFKEITSAFQTLRDPKQRRLHDQLHGLIPPDELQGGRKGVRFGVFMAAAGLGAAATLLFVEPEILRPYGISLDQLTATDGAKSEARAVPERQRLMAMAASRNEGAEKQATAETGGSVEAAANDPAPEGPKWAHALHSYRMADAGPARQAGQEPIVTGALPATDEGAPEQTAEQMPAPDAALRAEDEPQDAAAHRPDSANADSEVPGSSESASAAPAITPVAPSDQPVMPQSSDEAAGGPAMAANEPAAAEREAAEPDAPPAVVAEAVPEPDAASEHAESEPAKEADGSAAEAVAVGEPEETTSAGTEVTEVAPNSDSERASENPQEIRTAALALDPGGAGTAAMSEVESLRPPATRFRLVGQRLAFWTAARRNSLPTSAENESPEEASEAPEVETGGHSAEGFRKVGLALAKLRAEHSETALAPPLPGQRPDYQPRVTKAKAVAKVKEMRATTAKKAEAAQPPKPEPAPPPAPTVEYLSGPVDLSAWPKMPGAD